MAMRVVSAYRTISSEAACVIAGIIPICITLAEDSECYQRRHSRGVRKLVRVESLAKWQQEWDTSTKGRWTHRLIPVISTWLNRKHGEVNFHLTQFLSGHGCFRQYLHRFGHVASPLCPECSDIEESPEHVVFECPRFGETRNALFAVCGVDSTPGNIVQRMCSDEGMWNAVSEATVLIMSALQQKWRRDQRADGNVQVDG